MPMSPLAQHYPPPMYSNSNMAPIMQHNYMYDDMCQNIAPMAYAQAEWLNYRGNYDYCGYNYGGSSLGYKSFQNFLSNSACVISNILPDEKGKIEWWFDSYKYSTILILAVDDNTVTESSVDVLTALDKIEKRDFSLSNPLDPSKYYNEMRNSLILRASLINSKK